MASALLVGATGLVGSQILNTLLNQPSITTIHPLTRRALPPSPNPSPKLHSQVEPSNDLWASQIITLNPSPEIYFSALGTTRAQAGTLEAQHQIDHDLNLSLARAAQAAGAKVLVLISSTNASSTSRVPYSRMKAKLDKAVVELGFECAVIVKPGLIVGTREDSRPAEAVARGLARFLGSISGGRFTDSWAQDGDVIGRAAVVAGLMALRGEVKEKVWFVEQGDVVRLGRTEWKD